MKTCNKCKESKKLSEYHKCKGILDGHKGTCKDCRNKKANAYNKEHRIENRDKVNASAARYRIKNREKALAATRKWRLSNVEYVKEQGRKYRAANPEKMAAKSRKRRDRKANVGEHYTAKDYKITMAAFNSRCYNCNSTKHLCIDHHKPLSKGNPLSLGNAVVLCRTCNLSKGTKNPEDFYTKVSCAKLNKKLSNIKEI